MKNKKLLIGIGIIALVALVALAAGSQSSGLFQGSLRNLTASSKNFPKEPAAHKFNPENPPASEATETENPEWTVRILEESPMERFVDRIKKRIWLPTSDP